MRYLHECRPVVCNLSYKRTCTACSSGKTSVIKANGCDGEAATTVPPLYGLGLQRPRLTPQLHAGGRTRWLD
ncbi:hypothetical protein ACKI1I_17175 [Streptomyces turgidiscabies]|uniref:hypothetical protein n=1 Tax=Streptomyces turgidiscabies TaxID=85558 RepID=UPI0038F66E33